VALTQKKLKDLHDAKLDILYDRDLDLWRAKAKRAYAATHAFITDTRPDDVKGLLVAELEVDTEFRKYLATKKLRQKYWYEWFAELIIDKLWHELKGG
jgi:hypothetical protein